MLAPDQQKTELEIEKLRQEIQALKKPWYKKTEAWLPILVGLFGTYYLVFTGFFSVKSGELEARTAKLDYENEKKEDSSILLNKKLLRLNDSLFKNKNIIDNQNAKLKNSTGEKIILERQLNTLRQEINITKTQLSAMAEQKKSLLAALETAERQVNRAGTHLEEEHERGQEDVSKMVKILDKYMYDSLPYYKDAWNECYKINDKCQYDLMNKTEEADQLKKELAKYKKNR